MPQNPQAPPIGADVTSLMPIGSDVSALMGGGGAKEPSIYDRIAQAAQESTPLGAILPKTTAEDTLNRLPAAGAMVGTLAGGNPLVAGTLGAGGEALRRIGLRLIGKGEPVTSPTVGGAMGQEAQGIATEGAKQGAFAAIPIALQKAAPMAQTVARDLWGFVTGSPDVQAANTALSSGRGVTLPHNQAALAARGAAESVPARPDIMVTGRPPMRIPGRPAGAIVDASGNTATPASPAMIRPQGPSGTIPGNPQITSPYVAAAEAHRGGLPSMQDVRSLARFAIEPSKVIGSGMAQGLYSAAGNADPIGQMLRLALMSYLSGQNK